ncbi:hypothetical protein QZM42_31455 [Burkholderia vietnamiensis]|uniref:hypothetical protein n=1 Tax=Burkholderia vietnamiensis TaxID=60552 RepID=UPI00264E8EA0|nr:hypothetical protein [Burkholderia vietnamiensis]MDN7413048.1 hypothetical protein [Burkholderia vietnamiensis]
MMVGRNAEELLTEFLENVPMYGKMDFPFPYGSGRLRLHVDEINDICEVCEERRPFQTNMSGMSVSREDEAGIYMFGYGCVSCQSTKRLTYVRYVIDGEVLRLEKIGEWPRKKIKRDRNLQKFFKDDLDNFEKATICLANGYGIAAFAYFRRIVESNIDSLVKLVREDAVDSGATVEMIAALDELEKPGIPMSKKIEAANQALPLHLKLNGLNPLGKLYASLSEGVHSSSEEECLKKANAISYCLAFLVGELSTRKKHRESFRSHIADL